MGAISGIGKRAAKAVDDYNDQQKEKLIQKQSGE